MDHEVSTSYVVLERMLFDESAEPTSLPLSLLQYITNRFSLDHQIGSGGFAVVYKGMVGKVMVAVKKLSNTFGLHENKFHEEVKCLIKAKHKNIVRFLGYCAETQGKMEKYEGKLVMADQRNWLLCFEYVCNGSLDKHITDPEYLKTGQMTFASDIYSLGVIIMEILAGVRLYHEDESVVESWMSRLEASEGGIQLEQVRVCAKIGIQCMDLDPKKRPVVRYIIDRLDRASADYSKETGSSLFEQQVSFLREQFGERIGKLGDESLQKVDAEEQSEILEDAAERIGWLHLQEGQLKVGQLPLWEVQDMKDKVNRHSASNSSSVCSGFSEKNILDIFNWKAHSNLDRNDGRKLEKSHFINIFRKEELRPILKSSNIIGKDASAVVYKGVVDNALVAVKKTLNGNGPENMILENEVIIHSQIIHKNIVWLIGLCLEMDTPILVYEFLPRGSLHDILHRGKKVPLNLDVRLNIIAESAHGLAYLHSQARRKIRHGDVKPAHILLDDNFIPKISNFGRARLIARDKQHTSSVFGDITYIDPVYLQTGLLTEKSDVYSFGIVILELISRKKATRSDNHQLVKSFLEVHEKGKKATELFDKEIVVIGNLELLGSLAEIAVECLNLDIDQRPSMTDVAERLVILNRSHRSHAPRISMDYSGETDISSSCVEQKKEDQFLRVQDTSRPSASISSSFSTGLYKLNNLDIFNKKALRNIQSNGRRALENSSFMKIFRKEQIKPMLKTGNLIGKGCFSAVYKCIIDDVLVAVKTPLNGSVLEEEQFKNEVIIQSQVLHKNISRLIGCCLEMDSLVLVYEFLSGGSLHDILHSGNKVPLRLDMLLAILVESAQGLAYLHSQAHTKIVHRGIKPANILLDENFIPKISDFGISKLIARDNEYTGAVRGDISYMDPEYLHEGLLTQKSDVYSFGIVILEVISRKKSDFFYDNNTLVKSFLEFQRKGKKATDLFDKEIAVAGNLEILDCLAEIAMKCLNLVVDQRPAMTDVAERLLTLQRYHRSQVVHQ